MEANLFQSVLRVFYKFQNPELLLYENSQIKGVIRKEVLEERMSDLSSLKGAQKLPIIFLEIEEILSLIHNSQLTQDGKKVIPVIDNKGNFISLWSKTDILKNISGQQNADRKEAESSENLYKMPDIEKPRIKTDIKIKMEEDLLKSSSPKKEVQNNSIDSAEFITIKTLESLPIPMLALDTRGEVLFYNQDWVNIQKENKETLGIKNLMRTGKDIMAKLAFEGKLEITSILEIPVPLENILLKMRAILDDSGKKPEVIGYIFWTENVTQKIIEKEVVKEVIKEVPSGKKEKNKEHGKDSASLSSDEKNYYGKTLVELLREEEKKILDWAMEEAGGNQSNAAMLLGIPRQTFSFRYNKIKNNKMSNKLK